MPIQFTTVAQLAESLREGPFTSLGCYPKFYATFQDSEIWCFQHVKDNFAEIARRLRDKEIDLYCDINWEDADLYCDATGARIESAYAEPEESHGDGFPEGQTPEEIGGEVVGIMVTAGHMPD